ncbi:MAG: phosphoribosylglycinamide formyltransferase [Cyclobacteriaceae bacterium]|nr:phosphoribosylglycinamide formyltransferase [Cyclobacteriaceae bacterium]
MKRIAIFASGSGTNAENIMQFFKERKTASVDLVLSNKKDAKVLERAAGFGVRCHVFNRQEFYETGQVLELLEKYRIDLIVLAGFLWLVPENLLNAYPDRIINIHPALLPKYGGKGMYGARVHEAVINSGDRASGITIHYVNPEYDEGKIIFQAKCKVEPGDNADSLAKKIHQLEYEHFPKVIENLIIK